MTTGETESCSCPVCGSKETWSFFDLKDMPATIGIQWPSAEQAKACSKGDISLTVCLECAFIWNRQFDPGLLDYTQKYDNSLDYSAAFRDYANALCERLIDEYSVRRKTVIDIGCGKGHFLSLICERGKNRGFGFDTSFDETRTSLPEGVTIIKDFFGRKYNDLESDLICSRHVFEHIPDPIGFLDSICESINEKSDPIIYFEVPNVRFITDRLSIWDIIYEHCNYFSAESLKQAFAQSGFEVLRQQSVFGDQFISLDARKKKDGISVDEDIETQSLVDEVREFGANSARRLSSLKERLELIRKEGKNIILWGGGAKAVSLLNMLSIDTAFVPAVVDINPYKQGRHLPGTGQKIIGPQNLKEYDPDFVFVMNPVYADEIAHQLRELGLSPKVEIV